MESDTADGVQNSQAETAGKQNQLRAFIELESNMLLRTLRVYVLKAGIAKGAAVSEAAMELLSRVVIEALAHADRFDSTRQPRAWLFGIAANLIKQDKEVAANRLKREPLVSQLSRILEDESDEEFFERVGALDRPSAINEFEDARQAGAILSLLGEDERRVIQLAVLEEFDGKELARALGVKPGAARVRLHRALNLLRARLREQAGVREGEI